ncbi:hypothetical protein FACS1894159_06820 [Bacteroidia bacterium]|nr:hypothetical protein FACS1894159_06820 [Bacteroidia bacterium]
MRRCVLLLLAAAAALTDGCCRRPLEDEFAMEALIPVKIDWSHSGINEANLALTEDVHRVSLRFFPEDGSAAFDRYLESNVVEGEISVPVGRYSVVVFNESVYDLTYWRDAVSFTDVDSYAGFAANVVADDAANRRFYSPAPNERLIVEPLPLASWSVGFFEVTPRMVTVTRGGGSTANASELAMLETLTHIVMRRLTYRVNVEAEVKNLSSAQYIYGAARGFAHRVYMASAQVEQSAATHIFSFDGRQYAPDGKDGTARRSFLSFGRLPQLEVYSLGLTVYTVDGALYAHSVPLEWDVTTQVTAGAGPDINIHVGFDLPYIDGQITVDSWDDSVIIIQ